MSNLNKVMLIGRLGDDPSSKTTDNDVAVTKFSLATNTYFKKENNGDKLEKTEWHRIVAFNKLAEICAEYLKKGKLVYIEGRLQTRNYDKKGQTHYMTEIILTDMQMLGAKDKDSKSAAAKEKGEKK
jgi:single-strand DNA-binding protein